MVDIYSEGGINMSIIRPRGSNRIIMPLMQRPVLVKLPDERDKYSDLNVDSMPVREGNQAIPVRNVYEDEPD